MCVSKVASSQTERPFKSGKLERIGVKPRPLDILRPRERTLGGAEAVDAAGHVVLVLVLGAGRVAHEERGPGAGGARQDGLQRRVVVHLAHPVGVHPREVRHAQPRQPVLGSNTGGDEREQRFRILTSHSHAPRPAPCKGS